MQSTLFDFHSHVLPKMDDGAADLETSRAMLEAHNEVQNFIFENVGQKDTELFF